LLLRRCLPVRARNVAFFERELQLVGVEPQDHRGVKQRIAVMLDFKAFRNAAITIAGIELLHRVRKGQFGLGRLGVQGQAAPEVWNAVLGA
jgi:transposase-like protein